MRVQYLHTNNFGLLWPRLIHISALFPQVSIVEICWVHTAAGSEISQLWSTESGLFRCSLYCHPFFQALESWYGVSVALFMASSPSSSPLSTRRSLLSEGFLMDSHKLIALQTTKHNGLYPLLSISLTMSPFVEFFQQRNDPCCIGFYVYTLAFLSFFLLIS